MFLLILPLLVISCCCSSKMIRKGRSAWQAIALACILQTRVDSFGIFPLQNQARLLPLPPIGGASSASTNQQKHQQQKRCRFLASTQSDHREQRRRRGWRRVFLRWKQQKSLQMKEAVISLSEENMLLAADGQQARISFGDIVAPQHQQQSLSLYTPAKLANTPQGDVSQLLQRNGTFFIRQQPMGNPLNLQKLGNTEAPLQATILSTASSSVAGASSRKRSRGERGSMLAPVTRSVAEAFLAGLLTRWSQGSHKNLAIRCRPTGNVFDFVRGYFRSDASVKFDRMGFPGLGLQMSDAKLEARRLALNLWSFTPDIVPVGSKRYPNQFDFLAKSVTFTQMDLIQSPCIRNGLRRLITRILRKQMKAMTTVVEVTSIQILSSGKIACSGQASAFGRTVVPFEVRSGIGIACRGHIVEFPGLEISLNPTFGLFVPFLDVSLDLGNNAQLLAVDIDGRHRKLTISARATITPFHTLKLKKYIQSSDAFAARFSIDLGRWLTKRITNEEHV